MIRLALLDKKGAGNATRDAPALLMLLFEAFHSTPRPRIPTFSILRLC